jgi:hypothetical protein
MNPHAFRAALSTLNAAPLPPAPAPLTDAQERAILFRYLNRNGVSTTLATMADILREKAPGAASPGAARAAAVDVDATAVSVARCGL